jgi:hypothetical protein
MLKILHKVFTNQNRGYLLVDSLNQSCNNLPDSIASFFTTIFIFFFTKHKFSQQIIIVKSNFFDELIQVINFYHHSPKEWVSVPMPPFLK